MKSTKQQTSLITITATVLATATIFGLGVGVPMHIKNKKTKAYYQAEIERMQRKNTEIEYIQSGRYPAPNTRPCEMPEPLRNICNKHAEIADALSWEAHLQFKEIWKTKKSQTKAPRYGDPKYDNFRQAQFAYRELALDAAGFPMWRRGAIGFNELANKTEAEALVREELGMGQNEPIDFSWLDEYYDELVSRQ